MNIGEREADYEKNVGFEKSPPRGDQYIVDRTTGERIKVGRDAQGNAIHPVTKEPVFEMAKQSHLGSDMAIRDGSQAMTERLTQLRDTQTAIGEVLKSLIEAREKLALASKDLSRDVMEARMNTVSEAHKLLGAMKDIRQWFIGPDYQQEMARLKEFLGLCEQLRRLKEDGTLDAVADTIVKLAFGGK